MSFPKLQSRLERLEQIIANNGKYTYSCLALLGLLGMWLDFDVHSLAIGVVAFLLYFIPSSILVSRVFFEKESLEFRLFYGFALLLALTSISGSLTYLIYDYSNAMIMISLTVLVVILTILNARKTGLRENENSTMYIMPQMRSGKNTSNWGILDLLYLSLVFLCFYLLYSAHTGESLNTVLDVVPTAFFVVFLFATVLLFFMIFSRKNKTRKLLLYAILLVAIPTSVYILIFWVPVEPVSWWNIVWSRHLGQYGRFVSDPTQVEVASSLLHKQLPYLGLNVLTDVLSKFLQIDPMWTSLIIPIFYFTYLPITCYIQVKHCTKLKSGVLGVAAAVLFLFSQHNIFLITPPIKGETFALVFLFLAITFWVKYMEDKVFFSASFFVAAIFTITVFIIHQWAGQLALIAAVISIYLKKFSPFGYGFRHCIKSKGKALGFLGLSALFCFSLIGVYFLTSILTPKSFSFSFNPTTNFQQLANIVFPPLWFNSSLPIWEQIFYGYLNNFSYILYAFIIVGLIAALKRKANLNWIILILALVVVSIANMLISGGLLTVTDEGSYRSFYCLNLISSVLVVIGIYQVKESLTWIKINARLSLHRFKNKYVVSLFSLLSILILSGAVTASVYGGFPRKDSMGPYNAATPRYISEYDFAAAKFIKSIEGDWNNSFYVFGDLFTSSAFLSEFGAETFVTASGNYLFVSERPFSAEPWTLFTMITQQEKHPDVLSPMERIMNLTGAKTVYLVITYRFGLQSNFQYLVNTYYLWLGEPIFKIDNKIYVFRYQSPTNDPYPIIVTDDNQASNSFWLVDKYGSGNIDVSIADETEFKVNGNNSLKISIVNGTFGRFTLRHIFEVVQNWSGKDFLTFWWYGTDSGNVFNIVVRSQSISDFFYYSVRDNFSGWKRFIIPIKMFQAEGSPSWSTVSEFMMQFNPGLQPGSMMYLDDVLFCR